MAGKNQARGTLSVKVEEVRGLSGVNYITVETQFDSKRTASVKGDLQRWDETFEFSVVSEQDELIVTAMKRGLHVGKLGSDKELGKYRVGIKSFEKGEDDKKASKKANNEQRKWFKLYQVVKGAKVVKGGVPEVGEIRMTVRFDVPKTKKSRKLKGEVIESKWTKQTSGGTLMNHATWALNPQFLLEVNDDEVTTKVALLQPEDSKSDERLSFSLLRYDESFFKGRRVVHFNQDDIIKIDDFWGALFEREPSATLDLCKGKYVIIPVNEEPGYSGKFILNVVAKDDEDQEFLKISILGASAGKAKGNKHTDGLSTREWDVERTTGAWTVESSGGGDIVNSFLWRKNPQFLLTIQENSGKSSKAATTASSTDSDASSGTNSDSERESNDSHDKKYDVALTLAQREKDYSIGFYVMRYEGNGIRKMLTYVSNQIVAQTDAFRMMPVVGARISLPAGKYCIICCTAEPISRSALEAAPVVDGGFISASQAVRRDSDSDSGSSSEDDDADARRQRKRSHGIEFELDAHFEAASGCKLSLDALEGSWLHEVVGNGRWAGPTAGGGPSLDTFVNNQQFGLTFPFEGKAAAARVQVELNVGQSGSSVGFLGIEPEHTGNSSSDSSSDSDSSASSVDGPTLSRIANSSDIKEELLRIRPEGWVNLPAVTLETTLTAAEAKRGLILIPSTFKAGEKHHFTLTVRSDQPVSLVALSGGPEPDSDSDGDELQQTPKIARRSKKSKHSKKSKRSKKESRVRE